ncbi:RcgR family putative quorum lactone hydrolase [Shinella sp. HZN7]|uniref:RcgR family putative quorum lactone hydrolase n=1 Tax=Shinella sp. (strain HZN7) TaxID=879274 RepID=UPI0007DA86C7|nr:alpha/beta hydrolase [Shinella sp. HZN7]ANH08509.1 dienelactone hydrolase-related enzyme [Shinella sp. HZN7]
MFHNWLDRWDEGRAQRGEEAKKVTDFILDSDRAFPGMGAAGTVEEFCVLAETAAADPDFFEPPDASDHSFELRDGWLTFPSDVATDVAENNIVWAKITESGKRDRALVIFHHWNAKRRNRQIAGFLSSRGITVIEIAMPYHFERSRPGSLYADYMLSANLGRTVQALRQAVWDGRKLIRWLKCEGYQDVSVLGMSLGSWVAGLVAAHEPAVARASLFLTAGSLAEMVWTGRATRSIRKSLEPHLTLAQLQRAWAPLNLENHSDRLARPGLELHVILASRDTVVLPDLSERLLQRLESARVRLSVMRLNCGHYSLGRPPYILGAGWSLMRFLLRKREAAQA